MGVCNTDSCRVGLLNRPRGSPGLMTGKRQAWLCSSGSKIIRSCSADTQLPCQLLLSEFHLIEAIPIAKECHDDFMKFGRRIGLTDRVVKQEIKMFQEPNPKSIELIEKSFLSDYLKKQYITAYKFRFRMLNL